jgi:HlyD family secretion protein
VPNAALRVRPVETKAGGDAPGPDARRGGGGAPGGLAGVVGGAARPAGERSDNVYVLDDEGRTRAVAVKTGITDGRYTAIVGGDLKEGDRVAVGLETAKSQQTGSFPGMTPAGGRRGGRGI